MKTIVQKKRKSGIRNIGLLRVLPVLSLMGIFQLFNCAPVFSDLQSARMVAPGKVEITPSYSSTSFTLDGETEHVQNHYGVQFAHGSSEKTNLRFRYERVQLDDFGVNVIGIGPKFSFVPDRLAFYCPFGMAFGEDIDISDTYEIHPTLLINLVAHRQFDMYVNSKALIPIARENGEIYLAFNIGSAISLVPDKFAVRPEIGYLINPGEEGHYRHFSIGFSVIP